MESRQVSLLIESFSVNAEIEMMKAVNKEKEMNGLSLAYGEKSFLYCVNELRRISEVIKP